jgi:hypothetical protein
MKRGVFPGYCYDLFMTLHHTGVSSGKGLSAYSVMGLHRVLFGICIAVRYIQHGVKNGNAIRWDLCLA